MIICLKADLYIKMETTSGKDKSFSYIFSAIPDPSCVEGVQ